MAFDRDMPEVEALDYGRVEVLPADQPSGWDALAILWLPDPESRRGWREYYVRRPDPPKPGGRVGFR